MTDQRSDQSTNNRQQGDDKGKQDASHPSQQHPGNSDKKQASQQHAGSFDPGKQQSGANKPSQRGQVDQKPHTEQASHQGGGGVKD